MYWKALSELTKSWNKDGHKIFWYTHTTTEKNPFYMDNFKSANDCPELFPIDEGRNNLTL